MLEQINALKKREETVEDEITATEAILKNSKKELTVIKKARKMLESYGNTTDIPHEQPAEPAFV